MSTGFIDTYWASIIGNTGSGAIFEKAMLRLMILVPEK